MDELNEHHDDLCWHALNYRTARTQDAQSMWLELEACVERKIAAALLLGGSLQNSQTQLNNTN